MLTKSVYQLLYSYYLFTGLSDTQPSSSILGIADTGAAKKIIETTVTDSNQNICKKKMS